MEWLSQIWDSITSFFKSTFGLDTSSSQALKESAENLDDESQGRLMGLLEMVGLGGAAKLFGFGPKAPEQNHIDSDLEKSSITSLFRVAHDLQSVDAELAKTVQQFANTVNDEMKRGTLDLTADESKVRGTIGSLTDSFSVSAYNEIIAGGNALNIAASQLKSVFNNENLDHTQKIAHVISITEGLPMAQAQIQQEIQAQEALNAEPAVTTPVAPTPGQ